MTLGEIYESLNKRDSFWTMYMVEEELRNLITERYVDCEGKREMDDIVRDAFAQLEAYAIAD